MQKAELQTLVPEKEKKKKENIDQKSIWSSIILLTFVVPRLMTGEQSSEIKEVKKTATEDNWIRSPPPSPLHEQARAAYKKPSDSAREKEKNGSDTVVTLISLPSLLAILPYL